MEDLLRPAALRPGDLVALVPTARAVGADELLEGVSLLEHWGLRVRLGAGVGRKHFQFAGTHAERAADLQAAIDDPEVRAIWCARGGYGTVHVMESVDLRPLRHDPKWIIGFSDVTVLHNALHNLGLCSLHAQMPFHIGAKTPETRGSLRRALFGGPLEIRSSLAGSTAGAGAVNRPGIAEGVVVGGNLSLLYALHGTSFDIDPRGRILVLEDLDELLYHVDRMVMNLKLGEWFARLAGLVIGGMSEMRNKNESDPVGATAEEIIAHAIGPVNYPVCSGFPFGHINDNRALVLGQKAKLSVTGTGATLSFEGVVGPDAAAI